MRICYRSQVLATDDGTVYGFFAEADFCAEHEHGLGGIYAKMGCGNPEVEGIERYQPSETAVERDFLYFGKAKFWYRDDNGRKKWKTCHVLSSKQDPHLPEGGYLHSTEAGVTVSFNENNFLAISTSDEMDAFLVKLAEHGRKGDIAVFMGGGGNNPFGRGGIVIAIPSLTPSEQKETLRKAHENARLLEEAAVRTGIRERVKQKEEESPGFNSPYHLYAITPAWSNTIKSRGDGDVVSTEHDVIFWINSGRKIYGWYTVEELDQWLNGTGKVLTDKQEREAKVA
jgi:hypothetical protein